MSKPNEVIAILNSIIRIKIAPSPIHGVGIFALEDIPKGMKLYANVFPQQYRVPYEDFGQIKPIIRDIIRERWPQVVNNSPFMYPDTFFQGYMNHHDDPNYDAVNDITLKDIAAGEEVTEDYRKIQGWEKIFSWLAPARL